MKKKTGLALSFFYLTDNQSIDLNDLLYSI